MIRPRDYQDDAVAALFYYFANHYGNPLILMPTGTGKSVVLAMALMRMLYQYPYSRFMVLTHVETLVGQNHKKLLEAWPGAPAGIYHAGIGRRDTFNNILFAGIQSAYLVPHLFGHIDVLFIDEAHLVGTKDETMYLSFINALRKVNPLLKVVGLTATDWRLGLGKLTNGAIFTDVAIDMTTPAAWNWFVDNGYLAPLTSKKTYYALSDKGIGKQGGEYIMSQMQEALDHEHITRAAVEEMIHWGQDRHMWMVFASGVKHCEHVAEVFGEFGIDAVPIHSKTKKPELVIEDFKAGRYRCAVSMNKLTTGVDAPGIDLIGVLRFTNSSALWVQMLGRGTRPLYADGYDLSTGEGRLAAMRASAKQDCLVLDFARNTERLGPINDPVVSTPAKKGKKGGGGGAVMKMCVSCREYIGVAAMVCSRCGEDQPALPVKYDATATDAEVMTREVQADPIVELIDVEHITYTYHKRKNSTKPPSLCVTYYGKGLFRKYMEFICFEHEGAARTRARNWWVERVPPHMREHLPVPDTVAQAREFAGHLQIPKRIRVWTNAPKPQIMSHEYD